MKFAIDDKIELQILQPHHAEPLFKQIDSHRESLGQWLPWVESALSSQDTVDFIEMTIAQFKNNKGFQAAIIFDNEVVGAIGFHSIDWMNLKTSIGYWLSPTFVGKGIVTKATRFLTQYAFENFQLHRVEIRCGVDNHRSRAIPQRLGFVEEGTVRECEKMSSGEYIHHVVYGMLAREWK